MLERITTLLLMITVVVLYGCEQQAQNTETETPPPKETKPSMTESEAEPGVTDVSGGGEFSHSVTFRTTEEAPADFDAWTFEWIVPDRSSGAKLDYVVIEPDGEEHFQYDLSRAAPGQRTRSGFKPGFAGGDPAVFHGQHIRFQVRAVEGRLHFQNMAQFEFQFFRTGRDGQVDWKRPFARIKAVVQE